jgi:GxxExxY protein
MPNDVHYNEPSEYLDKIGKQIVDAAYKVHLKWGPGLLEHFYQIALYNELVRRGLNVQSEVYLPVVLDGKLVEDSYRLDLIVENEVIIEVKTVEKLSQSITGK